MNSKSSNQNKACTGSALTSVSLWMTRKGYAGWDTSVITVHYTPGTWQP